MNIKKVGKILLIIGVIALIASIVVTIAFPSILNLIFIIISILLNVTGIALLTIK